MAAARPATEEDRKGRVALEARGIECAAVADECHARVGAWRKDKAWQDVRRAKRRRGIPPMAA